jgi:hypothetical protein
VDKRQEKLLDYLVDKSLVISDTKEIHILIDGMTADQIIQTLDAARHIQNNLNSTSLGRVLS